MDKNTQEFLNSLHIETLKRASKYSDMYKSNHLDQHETFKRWRSAKHQGWSKKDPNFSFSYFTERIVTKNGETMSAEMAAYHDIRMMLQQNPDVDNWDPLSGIDLTLKNSFKHVVGKGYLLDGNGEAVPMHGLCLVLEYPAVPGLLYTIKTAYPILVKSDKDYRSMDSLRF